MDIPVTQLPPGDPRLVEAIVGQLKSRGIFDQFRKECLADVDLKPAYQNLRQRVEGQVNKFLEKQIWKNDLNKNQLRESVRKHVHDAGMLGPGIDAIISQVVNPKINSLILPLVEDTVYAFLQIDKPKRESKVLSEPEKDIMNYHIRDQNGQHHHHPPVMPKPPAPPPARAPLIPMDTDAISSEEDEILAHESPESEKRTSDDEKMELQMMDDNARDGFEDKSKMTGDGGLYGPDSVAESVEKLKIKEEPSRGTKEESTSQEPVKPTMLLFDNQSLDSISSNSSGLTFSPLSGRGSVKDEKIDDEGECSPPPSCEIRGEKQETGQNSNRSTPLIDEVKVEEGGSMHEIGSQLSQDIRSSRVGDPLEDVERGSSKEIHPPVPSPLRLPSLPPELSKEGNGKTISGASPISLDEDSEMSKCSQGTNSSRGEKSEGELSSKSEGEISSKSLKSEGEVSGKSGRTDGETKTDRVDKEPSIKSEKSEGEITSSSDSESRDTRDSYKPKRPDERHGSREDRHRSDGHRHKHDSRSSKERERDREKEKKREKSKDDHHSYKDKDRKHDRRDRDRDRDRSRGHHHSSSSRKESSSSSSDRRDKERSGHYSSDRSSKEGKSRSSGSSEKQEKKKVENKEDQGKSDAKVEEKKRDIKVEKSSDKSEIKKEAKVDIKKSENKNIDKGDARKYESKKLEIKLEDRQDKNSKDKLNKIKSDSKDKKENISIKSSKYSDKDKKDKKDKDKKNDDKASNKGKTSDRKPIEKKQIIVSLGKDRSMDKEPKNSFSKDIKKSKIASNNNETKTLNKARSVVSTKNNLGCDVDFSSYGSEPMVLMSNDGNLLFVNYSEEKKKHSQEAKRSSDSDGCRTPPLVDSPKSQAKQFIRKKEVQASVRSVPPKKRKEMNTNKEEKAATLKSVTKDIKKGSAQKQGGPTKLKSIPSKKKVKECINFEGFEVFERDTRLRTFLDSVVIIPDPLEEEDMRADDYFMVVSETQLPENFSVDDFVKQVEWMGVRVSHRTVEKNSTHTGANKGEEPEAPSDRNRARNRKRQASMSSTASNSSTSSTSGNSPKAKRMRRNVEQGKENEEEVMCLEDDRTSTSVLMAGYALPTPEDDGHRTSTREYEVDYSRRESSYSPLSPSSDSSEDTKAKATAGTSVCGAPTMPEYWKFGNNKQQPHHRQASLLISLNNGKVSVAKVGQQSGSVPKRGQDCKTAQLYKIPFSKPGSQPS